MTSRQERLVGGRGDRQLEGLVGFFVNNVVLRIDASGNPTFCELVRRVRAIALRAYAHQELPFERLVEAINPSRSLARHPLFQVLLTLDNSEEWCGLESPGISARKETIASSSVAKFDLTFSIRENRLPNGYPGGINVVIEYSLDLFKPETAEALARRLERFLSTAGCDTQARIDEISLLNEQERRQILVSGTMLKSGLHTGNSSNTCLRSRPRKRHTQPPWLSRRKISAMVN